MSAEGQGGSPSQPHPHPHGHARLIHIRVREINQLFNSMDPSPFREKDLDDDADTYIMESAEELPRDEPWRLAIHLQQAPIQPDPLREVTEAVHHYYHQRADSVRAAIRRLLREGRQALLVGLLFLALCFTGAELLSGLAAETGWVRFVQESLSIAGWVAMWRPMEIYLYEWWPLRRRRQLFLKLSHMPVTLQIRPPEAGKDH